MTIETPQGTNPELEAQFLCPDCPYIDLYELSNTEAERHDSYRLSCNTVKALAEERGVSVPCGFAASLVMTKAKSDSLERRSPNA